MNLKHLFLAGASVLALGVGSANAANTAVGLELALLIDVSGSVDGSEYALQMQGYQAAFNSAAVQNAIAANPTGSIAVTLFQWSGAGEATQSIGWTQITAATAGAFGDQIAGLARAYAGLTAPGSAIDYLMNGATSTSFSENAFDGLRNVIDVSGDGSQNDGISTSGARNAALLAGVTTINGLPILGSEAGLETWYQQNIQGGTNAFTLPSASFADFQTAITNKLEREIIGVPEPMSLALFGMGLAGLGMMRRRR